MPPDNPSGAAPPLPSWAVVSTKRREHIDRVTALLDRWATELALDRARHAGWLAAGRWHDALRDAEAAELRSITGDSDSPPELLHGPAAAIVLGNDGETREHVLEAIRWHTVGFAAWGDTGRALYMADFLEPGRKFQHSDRQFLANQVSRDFDAVFRQVVRMRMEWVIREGLALAPETVALWNSLC